jgi:hypothetical protein
MDTDTGTILKELLPYIVDAGTHLARLEPLPPVGFVLRIEATGKAIGTRPKEEVWRREFPEPPNADLLIGLFLSFRETRWHGFKPLVYGLLRSEAVSWEAFLDRYPLTAVAGRNYEAAGSALSALRIRPSQTGPVLAARLEREAQVDDGIADFVAEALTEPSRQGEGYDSVPLDEPLLRWLFDHPDRLERFAGRNPKALKRLLERECRVRRVTWPAPLALSERDEADRCAGIALAKILQGRETPLLTEALLEFSADGGNHTVRMDPDQLLEAAGYGVGAGALRARWLAAEALRTEEPPGHEPLL